MNADPWLHLVRFRTVSGELHITAPALLRVNGDHHVYPVSDLVDHELIGRGCWCRPRIAVPCDDCDDGCWKCQGGLLDVQAEHGACVLVIHNAVDGRP